LTGLGLCPGQAEALNRMTNPNSPQRQRTVAVFLRVATHVIGWVPLALLFLDVLRRDLTANPIQYLEQRTGYAALVMLVLSLAITPASYLSGNRLIQKATRTMGLYAFLYASLHFLVFTVLDYGLDLRLLEAAIFKKPFALVGFSAFLILTALAVTSFDWSKRLLRKTWKRLHSLIYLAALLVALHYAWAKKADIFRLQGDIIQSGIFASIIILLLIIRIPPIKNAITASRLRMSALLGVRAESKRLSKINKITD
jgi:sulfoxide reductase heme-binding subunit YedZ